MLYDIHSAFRHKRRWLPCQLFSLNSLTLTLIGVAAKLPVDLTTPMPSGLDQFSKLCGNSFVCISMGFLMPSVCVTPKKESLSNMLSLSILVVTVCFNTFVQIQTGVIFFFIIEHVIVMCSILALLWIVWSSFLVVADGKALSIDHNKNCFTEGKGSMLQRLKLAYLFGFSLDPQFVVSVGDESAIVAELCIVCSVVLLQAVFRSVSLGFCGGCSDYGWSVWVIVWVQVLTVVLGSFATGFRSLGVSVSSQWKMNFSDYPDANATSENLTNPLFRENSEDMDIYVVFMSLLLIFPQVLLMFIFLPLQAALVNLEATFLEIFKLEQKEDRDVEKYKNRIADGGEMFTVPARLLIEGVKHMKRLKTISKNKSVKNLSELLLTKSPSRPFHTVEFSEIYRLNETIEVSSLSVVVLVRIAQILLPSEISDSLVQVYGDAHEILHFVEGRMKSASVLKRRKSELAKALWIDGDCRNLLPPRSVESLIDFFLHDVEDRLPNDLVQKEALDIMKFFKDGNSRPSEPPCSHTLSDFIKQLFVDMLHMFLTQLPQAIYKEVTQSTAEGFSESVKTSLAVLWQIKSLETQILWSFPVECDVCDLISPRAEITQLQRISQEQDQDVNISSHVNGDHDNNILDNHDENVIVVVE